MKRALLYLVYLAMVGGAACGGDDTTTGEAGADATPDQATSADAASDQATTSDATSDGATTPEAGTDASVRADAPLDSPTNDGADASGPLLPYSNGSSAPGPGPTDPAGNSWHLLFDDEFNGTSLDTTKWAPGWYATSPTSITPPVNASPACFDPANVSVSGGSLSLTMTQGSYTDQAGKTYGYASGQVTTAPSGGGGGGGVLFDFVHGYFEARCFMPGTGSTIDDWPAFWATGVVTGTPNQWPATGEIDVVEGLGGSAAGHWHGPTPGQATTDDPFGFTPSPNDYTGWHVFGAEWTPTAVTWYYDGVSIGSGTPAQATTTPMYLLLSFQALTSGPVNPGTMKVDYVRVWQ